MRSILLVEDEALLAFSGSERLKRMGYKALTAPNGEKAIEKALAPEGPDLILMDIDLGGGIDGTEAARRILERRRLPIVFFTSHGEREIVEKVRGITRFGYVLKTSSDFVIQSSIEMAFELFEAFEKLRARDERIAAMARILDDAPASITVHDHAGRFLYANAATSRMHGYPLDEFLALRISDIDDPESAALIGPRIEEVERNGEARFEVRHRRKDGSYFPLDIQLRKGEWEGSPAIISLASDLSERKRHEARESRLVDMLRCLRELNAAIVGPGDAKALADSAIGALENSALFGDSWIALLDPEGGLEAFGSCGNGGFKAIKAALAEGKRPPCIEGSAPSAASRVLEPLKDCKGCFAAGSGEAGSLAICVDLCQEKRRLGFMATRVRPELVADGECRALFDELARDLSQGLWRRELERLRAENEWKFRTVFEYANVGIAIVLPDGCFAEANPAFERLLGYSPQELKGRNFREITHPDDIARDEAEIAEVLSGRKDRFTLKKRYLHKNGSYATLSLMSSAIRDDDGAVRFAIAVVSPM
jgi:PAS domain S-box-containing protein